MEASKFRTLILAQFFSLLDEGRQLGNNCRLVGRQEGREKDKRDTIPNTAVGILKNMHGLNNLQSYIRTNICMLTCWLFLSTIIAQKTSPTRTRKR